MRNRYGICVHLVSCVFLATLIGFPDLWSAWAGKQTSRPPDEAGNPCVFALTRAYGPLVEFVESRQDDLVFRVRGKEIFFQEGKMLSEANIPRASEFIPIFYAYKKGPQESLPLYTARAEWSHDFLDALAGNSAMQVQSRSRRVIFLNRPVTVHEICVDALRRVDEEIWYQAHHSDEVRNFILGLKAVYSTQWRMMRGINNRSYHSYGLALDLIPRNHGGKHIFWLWSAARMWNWEKIPLGFRWSPPEEVIRAFEDNGFIWGGKWYHFDGMHFEYRPEILLLNGALAR